MFRTLIRSNLFFNSIKYPIRITTCSIHTKFEPYVNSKYSYAYGRSDTSLVNDNINFFLDNLEKEDEREIIVSHTENKTLTNHEFVSDIKKLASGMYNKLRLRKGDTICLWSLNCYDWLTIFFACQSLGITCCTVNPYYKEHELAYAITKCRAKALFLPGSESDQNKINQFLNIFNSDHVQSELKNKGHIRSLIFIDKNTKQLPINFETFQLDELSIDQKLDSKILESVDEDTNSIIMYTSGTTGVPKGVVLSSHNIINNARIIGNYIIGGKDDAIIMPLPLFHSFALTCGAQVLATRGVKTVLTGYRFNVKDVVDSTIKHNGTFIMGTPTMFIDIVNYLKKNKLQIPSLRTVLTGAASFPPELYTLIKETIPHLSDLRVGYGMTETSPVVSVTRGYDSEFLKKTTVGFPIDFVEVKIVDANTNATVELDQEGELLVRGHNVMVGYFEDEEKTKETITKNNWLRTGDRATMDKNGYIRICGRIKEMIIKGGENIYPAEIEDVLHKHPDILDAYAFAVPDKRLGEVVGVWIKLVDNPSQKITEDEIKEFCKKSITSYKVPTYVIFTDSFPMTSTGKAKKYEMTRLTCEKLEINK